MILDAQHEIEDGASSRTSTGVGSDVIDLSLDRSIGNGEPMGVLFVVTTAADQTTGDEDYTFDVEYSTNAAQSSGNVTVGRRIFESGTPTAPAQDADLLVADYKFVIAIPPATLSSSDQYLGIRYTLAGTTPSITFKAYLVPLSMIEVGQVDYADGYAIT